ncbi:hypothetical protein DXC51_09800 [Eisenbergiella massiliensis]|uniref:Uncharacterized protein n=1 Tax=Eisenbergiella massiliensis TaxID=1720294 RepID=A0A3E3I718_9FIRM|nr:hypothetical protein DXC51_09800 [Eisenbergiella massiliensis]
MGRLRTSTDLLSGNGTHSACCQPESKTRCKQRGIKLVALQSSGVFDPRGSRQISMQAWLLGSLLAGIKKRAESSIFHLFSALPHGRCSILFPLSAFFSPQ